jgi:hypothetical protein
MPNLKEVLKLTPFSEMQEITTNKSSEQYTFCATVCKYLGPRKKRLDKKPPVRHTGIVQEGL